MARSASSKSTHRPDSVSSSKAETLFWWASLAIGIAAVVIHNYRISPWMLDDAFISFRYSENFAAGHGLIFNLGERVEGYTTFLWVFLLGIGKFIGLETISLARLLGWLSAAGSVAMVAFSYRLITGFSRIASAMAVLLLCSCGIFTPWPSSGMEVSLFGLLILATLIVYCSDRLLSPAIRYALAGFLAALMVMTRPEGILLAGVLGAHAITLSFVNKETRRLAYAAIFLLVYGGFFFWRYSYYGYLLPNTFYAKVGSGAAQFWRGMTYAKDMSWAALPLLLLTLVALRNGVIKKTSFALLAFGYLLIHIGYVIWVGGDCMPAFRFLAPLIPLLALLAARGVHSLKRSFAALAAIMVLAVGFNFYQTIFAFPITGHIKADRVAIRGKEVGLWLKYHVAPGTLIATNTAGTIPYYSGLPVVDMLGLNDLQIAHRAIPDMGVGLAGHEKGDGKYVLGRKPAIVQFHSSLGRLEPSFRSDRELYDLPDFHLTYHPVTIMIPSLNERAVFYVRNDFTFLIN